jgi:hypothetical protein
MHPFLDPRKLTDEEILEKIGKASYFLHTQTQLGHDPTVNSIKEVLSALELEKHQRLEDLATETNKKKNPKDLEPITLGELDPIPRPLFKDEAERKRIAKMRRRRK